jgi:c-di-GMP-related signal transduction protein
LEKFIARQPVFNHACVVFGYELLVRSGPENCFSSDRPDQAAAATADNLLFIGADRLTQGRRAFINCTRDFLVREFATILPKDGVVLEILETIEPDDELIAACAHLKRAGYLLALDDFCEPPNGNPSSHSRTSLKSILSPRRPKSSSASLGSILPPASC